jgi:ketosteroid isomerase-like protein
VIETIRQVNDQVLAIVNLAATGAASGVDTTLRTGQVYSFRDGRISALDGYYTVDDALRAVGLRSRRCRRRGHDDPLVVTLDR